MSASIVNRSASPVCVVADTAFGDQVSVLVHYGDIAMPFRPIDATEHHGFIFFHIRVDGGSAALTGARGTLNRPGFDAHLLSWEGNPYAECLSSRG
ncbi:hypothetical protein ACVH9Z_22915, partial [Rhodococcus opacus]